jgi:hypothetical protein
VQVSPLLRVPRLPVDADGGVPRGQALLLPMWLLPMDLRADRTGECAMITPQPAISRI